MDWIMQIAKEYGLFVALVAYVIWDSRERELRYLSIIDGLSKSFEVLKRDVGIIKNKLTERSEAK